MSIFPLKNEFNFFSFDSQRICFENKMIDLFRTFSGNTRHDIHNFWVSHKENRDVMHGTRRIQPIPSGYLT